MTVAGIRDAIQAALQTISGLRVYDTVPASVGELPAAWVVPIGGTYDFDVGGDMEHRFEIILLVRSGGSLAEAQDAIDGYLAESGTGSVKAAVDAATLSTHADAIRVTGYRDYGGMEYAGQPYLGVRFDIVVIT